MNRIVIDIDGVVSDSNEWLRKNIEESSGKKIQPETPETFQYKIDVPVEDLIQYINEAIVKYKDKIEPHNYGTTAIALNMLVRVFGSVTFLSARAYGEVEEATRYWLDKWFPNLEYSLVNLGEASSKQDWMKANGYNSIVEDRFRNANQTNLGGMSFLVNRPWNIGRQEEDHVIRVPDLYKAVQIFLRS